MSVAMNASFFRMNRALLILLAFAVSCTQMMGCFRESLRDSEQLRGSTEEGIVVTGRDGWRYAFEGGAYTVRTDSSGAQVLEGIGKRYRGESSHVESFHGSISFQAIEKVTVEETTPWFYFTLGALTVLTGMIIWIVVSFHGFKVG